MLSTPLGYILRWGEGLRGRAHTVSIQLAAEVFAQAMEAEDSLTLD